MAGKQKHIPVYDLDNLSVPEEGLPEILMLSETVNQVKEPLGIPHRTNYYGVGVCMTGDARMSANLETYDITPGCLIAMSPHIIKQWHHKSEDFRSLAILFHDAGAVDQFPYFESVARHIFLLNEGQSSQLKQTLKFIQRKLGEAHTYQRRILHSLIEALLCEVAGLYKQYNQKASSIQSRSQLLAADFKKLVNLHFTRERRVRYYAEKLCITTGHLTETVRLVTGKTPGDWIAEAVTLEACILLQNPALTVAQIADILHFPDQSVFGKYFKQNRGISPLAYRQQ